MFDAWSQFLETARQNPLEDFQRQALIFLSLTLRGLGLALILGIPLGVVLTRFRKLAAPCMAFLGLVQTIPSLALLGLLLPVLGVDQKAAIAIIVVYSVFPVVLNTYTGIVQVEPSILDAARGMGMTGRQILTRVELPLALPVVLAGVRTSAVYAVAMATLCAMVGAGGLGDYIVTGMARGDNGLVLYGALPILGLTLVIFWGLGGVAWLARRSSRFGLGVGGAIIILLAAYALAEPWLRPRRADIRIGAKNFTEGLILSEILKLMIEHHTDLTVEMRANLGSKLAYKAILNGDIDLYPEYTGNLLTGEDALALPVPADKSTITPLVRKEMQAKFHLILLDTFGLNNVYAACVPRRLAVELGLKKITDLRRVPEFKAAVDLEFLKRPDGWHGLVRAYDLHFRDPPRQLDPNLLYASLEAGQAQIVIGFATDWQIAAFDLVVLDDDRGYFPSYHGAPLVRESVLKQHPEIAAILGRLRGRIDNAVMQRLNGQVARDKRPVADVAREFLRQQGLLD
jgi:osmoprotectant transport system permease protein